MDLDTIREAIAREGAGGPVMWPQCYRGRRFSSTAAWPEASFRSTIGRTAEAVDYANTWCPNAAWVEKRCFVPVHPTYEPPHRDHRAAIQKVLAGYARARAGRRTALNARENQRVSLCSVRASSAPPRVRSEPWASPT